MYPSRRTCRTHSSAPKVSQSLRCRARQPPIDSKLVEESFTKGPRPSPLRWWPVRVPRAPRLGRLRGGMTRRTGTRTRGVRSGRVRLFLNQWSTRLRLRLDERLSSRFCKRDRSCLFCQSYGLVHTRVLKKKPRVHNRPAQVCLGGRTEARRQAGEEGLPPRCPGIGNSHSRQPCLVQHCPLNTLKKMIRHSTIRGRIRPRQGGGNKGSHEPKQETLSLLDGEQRLL